MTTHDQITEKATVLVVDDRPDSGGLVSTLLKPTYQVKLAQSGEGAMEIATCVPQPDLILLDVSMPGLSGYATCARLKANLATRDIPVMLLTARFAASDEIDGFELGAADVVTKPVSAPVLLARIRTHLATSKANMLLHDEKAHFEPGISRHAREIEELQEFAIFAMVALAETRDSEAGNHNSRTQLYVKSLTERLSDHPRFATQFSDRDIALFCKSAPLHDIGKVGIPDRILFKPGKLSIEEVEVIKTHTTLGYAAIVKAERMLGRQIGFLDLAKEMSLSHHEKWDGSGYPFGLAGDAIPLSARVMALADVYDALVSRRAYKAGISHEAAAEVIVAGRSKHFDPDIVDAFIAAQETFRSIAACFAEDDAGTDEHAASTAECVHGNKAW